MANLDATKKFNGKRSKIQEQNYDENLKTSSRVIEQRVVNKCKFNHPKDICKI